MVNPDMGLRLYQLGDGEAARFVVTSGLQVLRSTRDYTRAVQHYAHLQGIDPAAVEGPTHGAEEELELIERLTLAG